MCSTVIATACASSTSFALPEAHSPSNIFVNKTGSLSEHLIELLTLDGLYEENMTLKQAVEKTQQVWIGTIQGQNKKERTDLTDGEKRVAIRDKVVECASKMGLFCEQHPHLPHYTYGAWHGAFLDGVRGNLAQLVEAWKHGTTFETLVVLTGERDLRKGEGEQDSVTKLCDPKQSPLPFKKEWKFSEDLEYKTEYDMMRIVFAQVQLPEDMAKVKVVFVNAPRGSNARPSTKDTFLTWMTKYNPQPGTILACSYPLLWAYQQLAGETILAGHPFDLDTTAPALSEKMRLAQKDRIVSLIFDTVAKCLFEIDIAQSKERRVVTL